MSVIFSDIWNVLFSATKADMADSRVVEQEEGDQLARAHNMTFMEVSSKNNYNIDNVFNELATQLKAQYDSGSLSENQFDSFRLKYPDTTAISNTWTRCCKLS